VPDLKIALIGGSGIYTYSIAGETEELVVETRYGKAQLQRGKTGDREIYFLARHGTGHTKPPHLVNYRANIAALKKLGVEAVLSTAAVGSLHRHILPGSWVVIDQFIDFTKSRPVTFYDGSDGRVVHVDFTEPYCPELRRALLRAGEQIRRPLLDGGCYVCTEGPRFETPAEIKAFNRLGGDVVGMTNVPEVVLAREAGLCYAALALVTNYGAGISEKMLTHEEVLEMMEESREELNRLLMAAVEEISAVRSCRCSLPGRYWPEAE